MAIDNRVYIAYNGYMRGGSATRGRHKPVKQVRLLPPQLPLKPRMVEAGNNRIGAVDYLTPPQQREDDMHECPDCGQAGDCDGEDTWFDYPLIHHYLLPRQPATVYER